MKKKNNLFSKLNFILGTRYKTYYLIYIFVLFLALIFQIFAVTMIFPLVSVFLGDSINNEYFEYLNFLLGDKFQKDNFTFLLFFTCILIIISNIIFLFSAFLSSKIAFSIEKETRINLYNSYLKGNYIEFFNTNSSDLLNLLINETQRFSSQILLPLADIFSRIVLAVGLSVFLFIQMPGESFFIIFSLILFYLVFFFTIKPIIKKNNLMLSEENNKFIKNLEEILKSFKEIKIYNLENRYGKILLEIVSRIQKIRFFTTFFSSSPRFILEIIIFILLLIFFYFNDENYLKQNLSLIAIFFYCIFKILPSIQGIFTQYVVIKSNLNSVNSIYTKLNSLNKNINNKNSLKNNDKIIINNFSSLEISEYEFNYSNKKIFNNLNFSIKAGEKIGIIGPSGVGKTTFINLITGLLYPDRGVYKINDKKYDYDQILFSIKDLVSYVPQNMSINENSILNNILLEKKFEKNKFEYVTSVSGLNDFVNKLDYKFDTKLHSSTANFSGGQLQRIAIARALYRNPEILIIDEGFNQLDRLLEEKLVNSIFENKKLTIIMVYHKISNTKLFDKIYKIDGNKLNKFRLKNESN